MKVLPLQALILPLLAMPALCRAQTPPAQQFQQSDHDQEHGPGLAEAEARKAVDHEQGAHRDQNDRTGNGADEDLALVVHRLEPPSWVVFVAGAAGE